VERATDDLTPDRRRNRGRNAPNVGIDSLGAFVPAPRPAAAPQPAPAPAVAETETLKPVEVFDQDRPETPVAPAAATRPEPLVAKVEPPAATVEPLIAPGPRLVPEVVVPPARRVAEPEPVAVAPVDGPASHEPRNPALEMIERYTLAVAREPVREIDPDIEAALDDLARSAREEILAKNGPRKGRRAEPDTPWLAPIRKAWEPPAEDELEPRPSRWAFRRRVS
jgi:hypothetical protein